MDLRSKLEKVGSVDLVDSAQPSLPDMEEKEERNMLSQPARFRLVQEGRALRVHSRLLAAGFKLLS